MWSQVQKLYIVTEVLPSFQIYKMLDLIITEF